MGTRKDTDALFDEASCVPKRKEPEYDFIKGRDSKRSLILPFFFLG
jgi:hypothetical protein